MANQQELTTRLREGLQKATVSRGPRKGMLLAKCPAVDTDPAAVWLSIMAKANPFKVGFGHMLFMRDERRELYNYTSTMIQELGIDIKTIDRDRKALEALGVW